MSRDKFNKAIGRKHMTDDKMTASDSAEAEVIPAEKPQATFGSKVAQPEATPATLTMKEDAPAAVEMSDEIDMEFETEEDVQSPFSERDYMVVDTLEAKLKGIREQMRNAHSHEDTNFFALVCENGTLHALTGCQTNIIAQAFAQIIFAENNILIDLVAALLSDRETAILLPNVLHTMQEAINSVSQAQTGQNEVPVDPVPPEEKH